MAIGQNTAVRVPVKLQNATGDDKTGIVVADILNSKAQVIKANGTKADINLVLNTNWFELDSTQSKGVYQLLIPSNLTDILGPLMYTIYPAVAGTFNSFTGSIDVIDTAIFTTIKNKTDLLGTTSVATQADVTGARDSIKGGSNIDLTAVAGTGFNTTTDSLKQLSVALAALKTTDVENAVWNALMSSHTTNNTFGHVLKIIKAALFNRAIVDIQNNVLKVYDDDSTTVLYTCSLKDPLGNPANIYATERLKGT